MAKKRAKRRAPDLAATLREDSMLYSQLGTTRFC
jgi:hypothetical protein